MLRERVNPVPKQAIALTPELYNELTADIYVNTAKVSFAQVAPIPEGASIHDNGCGNGSATAALMDIIAEKPPKFICIKATDMAENAIKIYNKRIVDDKWPAESFHMDSNSLSFPDNTFTHSIANALVFVLPDDGLGTLKEMHRTLKPGGIAIANSWAVIPQMDAIEAATTTTRPPGTPLPLLKRERWSHPDMLRGVMQKAGFEDVKVTQTEMWITTCEIHRYATMLWSFVLGTSSVACSIEEEENWDRAIGIIEEELMNTEGAEVVEGRRLKLRFVVNVGVGMKSPM